MRSGFTLVETIVALTLLQFGMLAIVAISAVAARDLASARRAQRAQAVARNRVELLRSGPCPTVAAGVQPLAGGMVEYWRVVANGPRRVITDSVEFAVPTGQTRRVVGRAAVLCAD